MAETKATTAKRTTRRTPANAKKTDIPTFEVRCIETFSDKENGDALRTVGEVWSITQSRFDAILKVGNFIERVQ